MIFYHYFPWLAPGGFLGVDIFFVISGFVITGSFEGYRNPPNFGSFYLNFFARRVRRLVPALVVCVVVFSILTMLLVSRPAREIFATGGTALIGLSNIFLYLESQDYFGLSGHVNPFTHTWSLGVEEQFYVVFPILYFIFFFKAIENSDNSNRFIFFTIITISISLFLFIITNNYNEIASFYLSPFRFWELLIGCLARVYCRRELGQGRLVYISLIAFCSIIVCVAYPGLDFGVIPVIAACLATAIVLVGVSECRVVLLSRLLGNPLAASTGQISYSLYLYHWPLYVLSALTIGHSTAALLFALFLTIILSILSYLLVERPIRYGLASVRPGRTIAASFAFVLPVVLFLDSPNERLVSGSNVFLANAFQVPRLPNDPPIPCNGRGAVGKLDRPLEQCIGRAPNSSSGDIFVLGDSHAAQLVWPLEQIAVERSSSIYFINTGEVADFPLSFIKQKDIEKEKIFEHILKIADNGDLLFITFHRGRLNDNRDAHIDLNKTVDVNAKTENLENNLTRYVSRFVDSGLKVFLVLDTPLLSYVTTVETCALQQGWWGENTCTVTLEQDRHTRTRQEIVFSRIAAFFDHNVEVIDLLPALYGGEPAFNPITAEGGYRMLDWNHLSRVEALRLAQPLAKLVDGLATDQR